MEKPSKKTLKRKRPAGESRVCVSVRERDRQTDNLTMARLCVDDSDDDREVSRKVRTVRQAATKAVSKQREILLGDGGSEDEEQPDQEEAYMDRKSTTQYHTQTRTHLKPFTCLSPQV